MAMNANPTLRQGDIGFAAALIAAAGWSFAEAGNYPGVSGAYPRALSVLLAIGAVLVIVRALAGEPEADESRLLTHTGRFLMGVAALIVYIGAVSIVGYLLPSLLAGVLVPFMLGYRNLRLTVPVTLGTIAFILLVFVVILERPLPPDVLGPLLEALR